MSAPAPPAPLTPAQLTRMSIGYLLIGFGAPCGFAGWMLLRLLFLPGHHSGPLVRFQPDKPAFVFTAFFLALGGLLLGLGSYLVRSVRPKPPRGRR